MNAYKLSLTLLSCLAYSQSLFAYGSGGGGGSSCSEPQFSGESPKNESTVTKLDRFVVEASKNTDLKTLEVDVDGTRKDPKVTTLLSGDYQIELTMNDLKVQGEKVRITIKARSDEGCGAFEPYYIHLNP